MNVIESLREKRPILIIDIDGTLVDNTHRRHLVPKENQRDPRAWAPFNMACMGDAPIMQNIITVRTLLEAGFLGIYVTSRGNTARAVTMDQLRSIELPSTPLVMRPMDEPRRPWEWKAAVIDDIEKYYGYKVSAAIEDDPTVCAMYRERGIAVAQVSTRCAAVFVNY